MKPETKDLLLACAALLNSFAVAHLACAQTWIQTTAPITNWSSVASSADGTKLVAVVGCSRYGAPGVGPIYISTNAGSIWFPSNAPITNWASVASSATGTKLAAIAGTCTGGGVIYTSSDSGATWAVCGAPVNSWISVASSADGAKLIGLSSPIYTSTNSGVTWRSNFVGLIFPAAVTSSADGVHLAALGGYSRIFISHDSGDSWSWNDSLYPNYGLSSITVSADGTKLVVVSNSGLYGNGPGGIYTSTNSGADWTTTSAPAAFWNAVASSVDGNRLVAASGGGYFHAIYTSSDFGATWVSNNVPDTNWSSVATSADGGRSVATVYGGGIYVLQDTSSPPLGINRAATNAVLSWTVPSTDFALQQTFDLSTTNWTDVTNTITLDLTNLQNQVAVPLSPANRFYRLKH